MNDYVTDTCKAGQGHQCCRYLILGGTGFECAKLTSMRPTLDNKGDNMTARDDNCEGLVNKESIVELNRENDV